MKASLWPQVHKLLYELRSGKPQSFFPAKTGNKRQTTGTNVLKSVLSL